MLVQIQEAIKETQKIEKTEWNVYHSNDIIKYKLAQFPLEGHTEIQLYITNYQSSLK